MNVCIMAFHCGQRWRVSEREGPSVMWAETSAKGVPDEDKRGVGREVRKQVMKQRCEVCV